MPNWCNNYLILKHANKSKLEEALEAFNKAELLNYFVPMPAHIKGPTPAQMKYDANLDVDTVLANEKKMTAEIAAVAPSLAWGPHHVLDFLCHEEGESRTFR